MVSAEFHQKISAGHFGKSVFERGSFECSIWFKKKKTEAAAHRLFGVKETRPGGAASVRFAGNPRGRRKRVQMYILLPVVASHLEIRGWLQVERFCAEGLAMPTFLLANGKRSAIFARRAGPNLDIAKRVGHLGQERS